MSKQFLSICFSIFVIVLFERYRSDLVVDINKKQINLHSRPLDVELSPKIAPSWVPLPEPESKKNTVLKEMSNEKNELSSVSPENMDTKVLVSKDEKISSVNEHPRNLISEDTVPLMETFHEENEENEGDNGMGRNRLGRGGRKRKRSRRPMNPDGGRGGRGDNGEILGIGDGEINTFHSMESTTTNINLKDIKNSLSNLHLDQKISSVNRDQNLAKIRSRQGTILFTHIRRAGGTVLEDYVLKPFVKSQGPSRADYLCKEGELGRYYRMSASQLKPYAKDLASSALQWRHCPFGLHQLLPSDSFIYITMLRDPLARMVSWYAYCNKYSPNKCHAGKAFMSAGKPDESPASKFYTSRASLYRSGKTAFDRDHSAPTGTFHPNNLEYRLDDNYQTRMVCGGTAHDHAIPIGQDIQKCALSNLNKYYSFVAVTERYTQSVCVLAAMVNIPAQLKKVKNDKATTMTKKEPSDFRQNWGSYMEHDYVLYKEAHRRLDASLVDYPACK